MLCAMNLTMRRYNAADTAGRGVWSERSGTLDRRDYRVALADQQRRPLTPCHLGMGIRPLFEVRPVTAKTARGNFVATIANDDARERVSACGRRVRRVDSEREVYLYVSQSRSVNPPRQRGNIRTRDSNHWPAASQTAGIRQGGTQCEH